jgi:glycosyltransferase involved in cell wall biosynthesis
MVKNLIFMIPDISVVMPVYNGEKYLKEACDSVLNQSYENFEFIIVNDGSTDESESIIMQYDDPRIRYVRQANTGIGGALHNGCNLARGKYVARMDADDICSPNRFQIQKNFLDVYEDYVLVGHAVTYIDEFGKSLGRSFPYTSDRAIRKKFDLGSPICHPSVMMRLSAYNSCGGYKKLELLEDLNLWMELSKYGKVANLNTPLLNYRVLGGSISRSISANHYKEIISYMINIDDQLSMDQVNKINQMYRDAKRSFRELYETTNLSNFQTNSKLELTAVRILAVLGLSESIKAHVICSIKNVLSSL